MGNLLVSIGCGQQDAHWPTNIWDEGQTKGREAHSSQCYRKALPLEYQRQDCGAEKSRGWRGGQGISKSSLKL